MSRVVVQSVHHFCMEDGTTVRDMQCLCSRLRGIQDIKVRGKQQRVHDLKVESEVACTRCSASGAQMKNIESG